MVFILYFGTIAAVGLGLYLVFRNSTLGDAPTCMLCGKKLDAKFNAAPHAFETKALMEKEYKCEVCVNQ
ncbi:hypothetical protein FIU87_03250 [Bacillus sp. THAF10]|uniref:hypothetical protein n=1 Tax=Bacillus sp. THAF10 TaxID=2587848 RepID=UPI0012681BC9|nr:hypothetical protein [Bacillus sp. THAF10]QFT87658.1 hypothetical protein FIU87_03250 [Bacillus sp. THAF10]